MVHTEAYPDAGKTTTIAVGEFAGQPYRIEDYWDRVGGKSWMYMNGNPACLNYAVRSAIAGLPLDDEVLYGKIGMFGHLIHISELKESSNATD